MDQSAKHIVFVGRVQGVGFRFTAYNIANRYHLTGLVRNLLDGTVEMVAQGPPDDIDACVRDINNAFARYIRETKIEEVPPNPQYADFKITF
jgi:acylphosphatase